MSVAQIDSELPVLPPEVMKYMLAIRSPINEMVSRVRAMRFVSKAWAQSSWQIEFELQANKRTKLIDWLNLKVTNDTRRTHANISVADKKKFQAYVEKNPHQLKILDLCSLAKWNNADIQKMVRVQTNLECLKIDCFLTSETIMRICALKSLKNFQYRYNLINLRIKEICTHSPSLETLFLQGPYLTHNETKELVKLTRLQRLTLQNCFGIQEASVMKMIQDHTGLRTLKIMGSEIKETTINALSRLTNLHKLTLSGCKEIRSLNSLSKLTNLSVLTLGSFLHIKSLRIDEAPLLEALEVRNVTIKLVL